MISYRLFNAGLAALAASCAVIAVAMCVLLVPGVVEDITLNHNEHWAVEVAVRILAGESLHARADSIASANMPPLWNFLLAVTAGRSAPATLQACRLSWPVLIGCIVILLANIYDNVPRTLEGPSQRQVHSQDANRPIAAIAGYSDRVACEHAILCIRAGKFGALDFYNVDQALETRPLKNADVVQSLARAGVQAFQFYCDPGRLGRLPNNTVAALLQVFLLARLQTDRYPVVQRNCSLEPASQASNSERRKPTQSFGADR
jgi:hypothetical protein